MGATAASVRFADAPCRYCDFGEGGELTQLPKRQSEGCQADGEEITIYTNRHLSLSTESFRQGAPLKTVRGCTARVSLKNGYAIFWVPGQRRNTV